MAKRRWRDCPLISRLHDRQLVCPPTLTLYITRNNRDHCHRRFRPPDPRPAFGVFPLRLFLARAVAPAPLLANRTAFLTFKTVSPSAGFLRIFLVSLSIFAMRAREAFFSFSPRVSVGSNCQGLEHRVHRRSLVTNLPFNASRFLFALQLIVKPAHACGADAGCCECLFDLRFPPFFVTCG